MPQNPERWRRGKDLFRAALRLAPEERSAYLQAECAGDEVLRRDVEALLSVGVREVGCLERLLQSHRTDYARAIGSHIDKYHIRDVIGVGGMSVVFVAEQEQPRREVALKVIKHECTSPQAIQRFEQEVAILKRLQHPSIAQVYDLGAADIGWGRQPYFAMEFVDGRSLMQYAQVQRLETRDRLTLFANICDTVQYAHSKGVIHRDLKPANIFVTSDGQPKILDFGVARVTDDEPRLGGPDTAVGQLIGTLAYMSPEQLRAKPDEIDVQSDIYSLGVIVYELLTGCLPYAVEGKTPTEILRLMEQEDPLPLRDRDPDLRGDINTVVAKALMKDREVRYASASELAEDVRRVLRNDPVLAMPPSFAYQARKLASRHKPTVAVSTLFLLCVIAFGVVATILAARIATERDRAIDALAVAGLMQECTPIPAAGLDGHVENLKRLHHFLADHPKNSQLNEVRARLVAEEDALAATIELALAENYVGPAVRLLVADQRRPTFETLLASIDEHHPDRRLTVRLRTHLEQWLQVPPPRGCGQEMHDCVRALLRLNPGNQFGRAAEAAYEHLHAQGTVTYQEDFVQYAVGERPSDWTEVHGVERMLIQEPGRRLRVASTRASTGEVRRSLPPAPYALAFECTVRFPAQDLTAACASVSLRVDEGGATPVSECAITNGHFATPTIPVSGGIAGPVVGQPVVGDQDYRIELWYYPDRRTTDVLVNGDFLVEEATSAASGSVSGVAISAGVGAEVLVDDVRCSSYSKPQKRDLGAAIPRITIAALPLRPLRLLPIHGNPLAVHDFDDDGRPEIVSTDRDYAGTIHFWRVTGTEFELQDLRAEQLPAERPVRVIGLLGDRLALNGFGSGTDPDRSTSGFAIVEVDRDLSTHVVFQSTRRAAGDYQFAAINLSGGRRGFVTGMAAYGRGFEIFAESPAGDAQPYASLGYYQPSTARTPEPSDVLSVLACDADGDGTDELLFFGWGFWNGYCPGVIAVGNAQPVGAYAGLGMDQLGQSGVQRVPAQPLTAKVGLTRVALAELDGGIPHLISASQQARTPEGSTSGEGVRVWRATDVQLDAPSEPLFFDPGNATRLAVGRIEGRQLFAAAFDTMLPDAPNVHDQVCRVYCLVDKKVRILWEAHLPNAPCVSYIAFEDVNGDHEQELLIGMGATGVLVLAVDHDFPLRRSE